MSAKRNDPGVVNPADARTKLARLLETEDGLEAMLEATRRDAERIIDEAKQLAEERARRMEEQTAEEDDRLRRRIAEERDRTIDQIRADAQSFAQHLDNLDPEHVEALAQYVLERLFGQPDTRGAR